MINKEPFILSGASAIDDRGQVSFANKFDFVEAGIRRHYLVSNHQSNFVRAWHAHRRESKYVLAVSGSALVCAVKIINWSRPRKDSFIHRFVLSVSQPSVLAIPPGYANGWMSLASDCQLLFFSTSTVEESQQDDHRYPARYWNPWKVEER